MSNTVDQASDSDDENTAEMKLAKKEIDAIDALNFEEAIRVDTVRKNNQKDALKGTQEMYALAAQNLNKASEGSRQILMNEIESETQLQLQEILSKYQQQFVKFESEDREEINQIRKKWISAHEAAEYNAKKKIQNLLHTSKVLASCKCYGVAINVRDSVETGESNIIDQEVKQIDLTYQKQVLLIIKKQNGRYNSLYLQMKKELLEAKQKGEMRRKQADVQFQYEVSMSPIKMITKIANDESLPLDQKKKLIHELSPRKNKI